VGCVETITTEGAARTQLYEGIGNTFVSLAIIVHNVSLMTLLM
jgi:hypothetical protein